MMLRCIYCNRNEKQTKLSSSFACIDRKDCDRVVATKDKPTPQIVCIWFDAACRGSNTKEGQPLGIGIYTTLNGEHKPEWCGTKAVAWGSNNDGEWIALLYALSVAVIIRKTNKECVFKIFGDSQFVINSFNDACKVSAKFRTYKGKSDRLRIQLGLSLQCVQWLPREHNKEADKLSKVALLEHDN